MYKPIIGLEIHIELNTQSKMFCDSPNEPDEKKPNVNICPVCTAQPGVLPVTNKEAVRKVVKTGLALNCQIPEYSKFNRKNYFYPDLPKGYQISQYDLPLCKEGFLNIEGRKIRITRVHLEEDTGKLLHPKGADCSLVDFNRAGVPLMELVTEPDITSSKEAKKFAEELQLILRYLEVSNADMEKGQLRVEVNISLQRENPKGARKSGRVVGGLESKIQNLNKLGTKVEIKNLNSFKIVEKAIDYEIKRQEKILKSGKKIVQETRGWDEKRMATISQREKEEAHDYRYFPEPDLPPMKVGVSEFLNEIKSEIPELPQQRRERFKKEYNLSEKEIEIFVWQKELGEYFEKVISELKDWLKSLDKKPAEKEKEKLIKITANYIISDLLGLLRGISVADEKFLITPENFAEFITLIYKGDISSKIAKTVLQEMYKTGSDPSHIIEKDGLAQVTDEAEINKVIKKIISENQKAVADYKNGKETALQFLIGQIMEKTKGKARPDIIIKILKKELAK